MQHCLALVCCRLDQLFAAVFFEHIPDHVVVEARSGYLGSYDCSRPISGKHLIERLELEAEDYAGCEEKTYTIEQCNIGG
jgi:hypothetical protein